MYYLLQISDKKGCDIKNFTDEHDLIVYCRNKFELYYQNCKDLDELDYSLSMLGDNYDYYNFYESKDEMLKDILKYKFDIDAQIDLLRLLFKKFYQEIDLIKFIVNCDYINDETKVLFLKEII